MYTRSVNVNIKRRIRQIIVLVFTIIMGVLISQATQAKGPLKLTAQSLLRNKIFKIGCLVKGSVP
ncbi:MAG: hypothetical protein WDO15_10730 [Bacteroidota bacterium]